MERSNGLEQVEAIVVVNIGHKSRVVNDLQVLSLYLEKHLILFFFVKKISHELLSIFVISSLLLLFQN